MHNGILYSNRLIPFINVIKNLVNTNKIHKHKNNGLFSLQIKMKNIKHMLKNKIWKNVFNLLDI